MSNDLVCHVSLTGGIDDRIAKYLDNGYTKEEIGSLRGLYDMDNKEPLINPLVDDTQIQGLDLAKAATALMEYKNTQNKRHKDEMTNSQKHLAKTFNQLYHVPGWDLNTRRNRINMVASEFSVEVSRRMAAAQKAGLSLSREQIVNGYKTNGEFQHGQLAIFESVFNRLLHNFSNARRIVAQAEKATQEQLNKLPEDKRQMLDKAKLIVQEYPKIFQNWAALCTFARMSLRDTESLKLGQTLEYAAPTTPDNFSIDSPLEDTYNLEESVRDAWMQHSSEISAFGSLGSEVRRFLSTITDVHEDGSPIKDDLNYPQRMDPLEMHTYLSNILRGITTESGMIKKLQTLAETDPKVAAVFKALANTASADLTIPIDNVNKPKHPVILTQLLVDMHKNMIPYTALLKGEAGNIYAKVLNRATNPLHDEFTLRMKLHQPLDNYGSVYDKEGYVDWEKLATWNAETALMFPDAEAVENPNSIFAKSTAYNSKEGFWGQTHAQRIEYMKRAARALGIPMTDKAARKIYNNSKARKNFLTAIREFRVHTRKVHKGDILDRLEVLEKYQGLMPSGEEQRREYREALDYLKSIKKRYVDFIQEKYAADTNPKSEGAGKERIYKALDTLADASTYLEMERSVPWYDRKGHSNRKYSDRTPSYMGDLIEKIHLFVDNNDAAGLRAFIMDKWGQSSFFYDKSQGRFLNTWLQEMYDSIQTDSFGRVRIDANAMAKVFAVDEFLGSNIDGRVSIFENFTERQHAEAMLKQYVQMLDQSRGVSPLAKYPCFILGDSGAQMFFTASRYSKEAIIKGLKDVFKQEFERINYVKATNNVLLKEFARVNGFTVEEGATLVIKDKEGKVIPESRYKELGYRPIENFSQTANEFTMLKFLNPDYKKGKYWKILTDNKGWSDADVAALSKEKAIDMAKNSYSTDALTDALQEYMKDALADFKHKLATVGVLKESKSNDGTLTYTDVKGIFKQNTRRYKDSIDNLIEDFFWNTKYATIQQLQLFTIDPAFYDHRYPIKDLQKRYKEIYAPGKGLSTEARNIATGELYTDRPYEKVVYFDDIAVSSEDVNPQFWEVLKRAFKDKPEILNAYQKNTLTDGQAYRSLKSYRAVKGMAGEWTAAMENAYNRIMDIRNSEDGLTDADIKELSELAVVFQPIKPYFYGFEKIKINSEEDMALVPVQHKYAEVVLIPELMQEGKLKDMAIWMENNDIDLVASTKCVKVGAFGSTVLKDANTTEAINNALDKAYVHNLSWSDYRIQSGVPEHLNHAQLFGTQIRKLILAGIQKGKPYDYLNQIFGTQNDGQVYIPGKGKVNLTGENLISFYNSLIMANLFDSYDMFSKETGNNKALSNKMIQNIISNANQSEDNAFGLSLMDDGAFEGDFLIPLGEPGMEHDSFSLLSSLLKKLVNKQKILGGSAVQASAMGLSGYADSGNLFEVVSPEEDNVLYDEIEMPWNLSYTTATDEKVGLNFEDWCNPDGTLKMSDQIVYGEDAREYLPWPVSGRNEFGRPNQVDENGYDPNGYHVPLIETKYKGILDIIAYRIPTERTYSTLNCKVFRFSNPTAGGTMKVPSSRTTTAGFDFDIDKLYFFMKEFAQSNEVKNKEIWDALYTQDATYIEFHKRLNAAKQLVQSGLGQAALGEAASIFGNSTLLAGLAGAENKTSKLRDYHFWEFVLQEDKEGLFASIPATPEEAFNKYMVDHNIALYDTYNPNVSPLNPVIKERKDGSIEVVSTGNSRAARNNMLIDLIRQRLMDKETLKDRYTPGGFENNRDAALKMRILQFADSADITTNGTIDWAKVDAYAESIRRGDRKDPEPDYDVSDPTAILVYNQQNQVASKLIGIFANQNTNHAYASTMQEMVLKEPIRFGRNAARGLYDFLHAPEGVDVNTNMAEYLAASVDAVKDPVLNFLNLNLVTASAGALLARIGYTPQEVGLLFNQPIIKDVCNYSANEGVTTKVAIREMLGQYGGKDLAIDDIKFDPSKVTSDELANNILESRKIEGEKPAAFKQKQLHALWLFNEIMADTADLNNFVQVTKFTAANSIGSTWGEWLAQEERVQNYVTKYTQEYSDEESDPRRINYQLSDSYVENQSVISTNEDLLELSHAEYMAKMSKDPLAFEQCMMDICRKVSRSLFKKHFPYYTQLYTKMRNIMRSLTDFSSLDADTINSLHREFMVYLLSKQRGTKFDGEALNYNFPEKNLSNREYYTGFYPHLMQALKEEGALAGIPFFQTLLFNKSDEGRSNTGLLEITVRGMGNLQSVSSNWITEAWAQAYNSGAMVHSDLLHIDIPVRQLAEDLYFYNFFKMGYNYHPKSSMSLAPTLLKLGLRLDNGIPNEDIGYLDFITEVIRGEIKLDRDDLNSFAKQYILNHLDNNKFVFTPKGNARSKVEGRAYDSQRNYWNTEFSVSINQLGKSDASLFTMHDDSLKKGEYAFKPVIAVERGGITNYYMADSSNERFNVVGTADGKMTYRLVYAQGAKGKGIQYFGKSAFTAYQRNGGTLKTDNGNTGILEDMADGTPPSVPESTHIEVGQDVSSLFTDAEWNQMFQAYKQDHMEIFNREEFADYSVNDFKTMISDTSSSQNVDILNDLSKRIDRGEKMHTLDDQGNDIMVC